MARAPKPSRPKKKTAPAQPAAKKPVPDDPPPNVRVHDRTLDKNEEIINDCIAAVREHRTMTMEERALLLLSTLVSTMMVFHRLVRRARRVQARADCQAHQKPARVRLDVPDCRGF
jgi:hypothetical protein